MTTASAGAPIAARTSFRRDRLASRFGGGETGQYTTRRGAPGKSDEPRAAVNRLLHTTRSGRVQLLIRSSNVGRPFGGSWSQNVRRADGEAARAGAAKIAFGHAEWQTIA